MLFKHSLFHAALFGSLFVSVAAKAELNPKPQYWIYTVENGHAVFRFPWDSEGQGDVSFDDRDLPDYGRACSLESQELFQKTFSSGVLADRLERIRAKGATSRFTHIVNVIPSRNFLPQLRRWDRDPYFWHWNGSFFRPELSMSNFRRGTWVWESIAYPGSCLQPKADDISRYLEYVEKRMNQNY